MIREHGISCQVFQQGGRGRNDAEKKKYGGILFPETRHDKVTRVLLMLLWKEGLNP